ncbi:hypothetical protein CC78DRAFT_98838 [Lojkania enalia]|uniref:Uncharacterized protein n=1 Tax=Lojkania enalia TaxID=147567 RepID=A0A9P4K103_9PLEO|nr:hypothetical protein CC78DRAFT_98838 [Didymosphaeria enalia]
MPEPFQPRSVPAEAQSLARAIDSPTNRDEAQLQSGIADSYDISSSKYGDRAFTGSHTANENASNVQEHLSSLRVTTPSMRTRVTHSTMFPVKLQERCG